MIYQLHEPIGEKVPIVVSVPHCGIKFPVKQKKMYKNEVLSSLDDTDWFVNILYDFVTEIGITMITAQYHRWLIDLNRNPESKPLYNDGRIITGLIPTFDFNGNSLYNTDYKLNEQEITLRLNEYYHPYYDKIKTLLEDFQKNKKHVLLYDAHSIRQYVPGIHPHKFPDLILGDVDKTSASINLIDSIKQILSQSNYSFSHNYPFKGGNLTRHFGNPSSNRHALQLEMSKLVYMEEDEKKYNPKKADKIRNLLRKTFNELILVLERMNT